MGQVWRVVLPRHCGAEVAQHLCHLFCPHSILQRQDSAGVPEVCKPNVIQPGLFDDLIVQPAHCLRQIGLLCSRVHEHERAAGVLGVFQAQELNDFLRYPGFFTLHSMGFMGEDKSDGRLKMQQTWRHILDGLCAVLRHDSRIRPDAFTPEFTPRKFADVLFSLILSALLRQDYDPSAVLELVRRTLY